MTALKTELETTFQAFAGAMLQHPSRLTLTLTEGGGGQGCEVAARPYNHTDKGKLIGGQAETHRAMQILLSAVAHRRGKHCRYIILPSYNEDRDANTPFVQKEQWDCTSAMKVMDAACGALFSDHSIKLVEDYERGGTQIQVTAPVVSSEAMALVEWSLNKLMHAIGNAQGNRLFVTIKPTK